jgi:hypothetical protein
MPGQGRGCPAQPLSCNTACSLNITGSTAHSNPHVLVNCRHNRAGEDMVANHAAGHVCWDARDVMGGRPTGAVRASLGHASTLADVHVLLRFLAHYFVDPCVPAPGPDLDSASSAPQAAPAAAVGGARDPAGMAQGEAAAQAAAGAPQPQPLHSGTLARLFLYPVKSCGAQEVRSAGVLPVHLHSCAPQHTCNSSLGCSSTRHPAAPEPPAACLLPAARAFAAQSQTLL